jgi:hypothetical protein
MQFSFITIAQSGAKSKFYRFFLYAFLHCGHTKAEPNQKEETTMNYHANKCIECTVKSCAYHCDTENYCSLDRILVGTHEANPTQDQCTDCKSFRSK